MINIVFVDDEYIHEKVWHKYLKDVDFKYFISIYESPKKALEEIANFGYNTIIVLDMKMDELDGDKFLHAIREKDIFIPVIIYSANAMMGKTTNLNQLIKDNIFSYIDKGQHEELVRTIKDAATMIKDAIPLELSEALHEFLNKRPERKETLILTKDNQKLTLQEVENEINKKSEIGIDYQKALYKMSFERLIRQEEKL